MKLHIMRCMGKCGISLKLNRIVGRCLAGGLNKCLHLLDGSCCIRVLSQVYHWGFLSKRCISTFHPSASQHFCEGKLLLDFKNLSAPSTSGIPAISYMCIRFYDHWCAKMDAQHSTALATDCGRRAAHCAVGCNLPLGPHQLCHHPCRCVSLQG